MLCRGVQKKKKRLYSIYLRPIAIYIYACETRAGTKGDEGKHAVFKRKIGRRTYGPVYNMDLRIYISVYILFRLLPIPFFLNSVIDYVIIKFSYCF